MRVAALLDMSQDVHRRIYQGIQMYAQQHAWEVIPARQGRPESPQVPRGAPFEAQGLIGYCERREEVPGVPQGFPMVNISSSILPLKQVSQLVVDETGVMKAGVEHLVGKGAKYLVFVAREEDPRSKVRAAAFRKEAGRLGCACRMLGVPDGEPVADGAVRSALAELLEVAPKPVGLLGADDRIARAVSWISREIGLKMPADVAVLGIDDDAVVSRYNSPQLTSIRLPMEKIGFEAATVLHAMMNGAKVTVTAVVPSVDVVQRRSTEVLAVEDVAVAAALQWIRDHVSEPFHVNDVTANVPVNRRTLEMRFRQHLGRSINESIRDQRIEKTKEVLRETELPMPEVAERAGFSSAERMTAVFRKVVGTTPTDYRRRNAIPFP